MINTGRKVFANLALIALTGTALTACSAVDRVKNIGEVPPQSSIQNPVQTNGYKPISMPMPESNVTVQKGNSLWTGAQQGFFKDQRAKTVGDIMTVLIDIDDKGKMQNSTDRSRSTSEKAGLPNLLGMETQLTQVFPETLDTSSLTSGSADSSYKGDGTTDRKEKIEMKLAVTVTQVLPNGNMVIQGAQEVRVNYENRKLQLAGIVRPQDISTSNTVSYEQIAEARISYGGNGQITDVQQPRYGTQLYDIIFPF
ncbi:MAG: flagellar basal body L-ring protein FlgH [Alphaproteobacteria bacterium]|nr:flagellar basal body L-ring protein FlgH [Alphaproteobacteria bacterium]MCB9984391.1 flagellar basal body L-ring protein FlgH [Micavibrio sp.]HRK97843.1 flagellar basal body L-ring protein FlgH [Alphaproteobacteria bacterium]